MTTYNLTPATFVRRTGFNTGSVFTFDCVSNRGGAYRVNATAMDDGGAVADVFRIRDGKTVSRMTSVGSKIHTLAIQHIAAATA